MVEDVGNSEVDDERMEVGERKGLSQDRETGSSAVGASGLNLLQATDLILTSAYILPNAGPEIQDCGMGCRQSTYIERETCNIIANIFF